MRRRKWILIPLVTVFIFAILFGALFALSVFFDRYKLTFQTPVVVQSPIVVNERQAILVSPESIEKKRPSKSLKKVSEPHVNQAVLAVVEPTAFPSVALTPAPIVASDTKSLTIQRAVERFGVTHKASFEGLMVRESGFNPFARNGSSGACGIFQAHPCTKLLAVCGTLENIDCQIEWGLNYIARRYETPTKALEFWKSRVPINGKDVGHWY